MEYAHACGGWWDEEDMYHKFFHDHAWIGQEQWGLLYTPYGQLYVEPQSGSNVDSNLALWERQIDMGDELSREQLNWVVYEMSLQDIREVGRMLEGARNIRVSDEARKNPLVQRWFKGEQKAAFQYLLYAKRCEPQCIREVRYWWDESEVEDVELKLKLIKEGRVLMETETDPLFRQRYGFQLVRMAHYAGDYPQAIELFERYVRPVQQKTYIYYRTLEQFAGVLHGMDDPNAARYFVQVYNELPDRREVCLRSFFFTDDEDWQTSFDRCENDEERALMYMLRALRYEGFEIEEMENIFALNPKSELLTLLMARQVNMFERGAFPSQAAVQQYPDEIELEISERLFALCEQLIMEGREEDRELFIIGKACLLLYSREFVGCRETLTQIPETSVHHAQARLLNYVSRVSEISTLDQETEDALYTEYLADEELQHCEDLLPFLRNKFSSVYMKQDDWAKAFLCHNEPRQLRRHLDLQIIDDLIRFQQQKDQGEFEQLLSKGLSLNELYELKGSWYMQRNRLKEAIEQFDQLNRNFAISSLYNGANIYRNSEWYTEYVFAGNVKHHFDTNIQSQSDDLFKSLGLRGKVTDKKALCQTMLDLEQRARENPNEAALIYYVLGCAWNNMSPYGWYRNIMYHRETNDYVSDYECNGQEWAFPLSMKHLDRLHYYNPGIALRYFDQSKQASSDREWKARCTFYMAEVMLYANPSMQSYSWGCVAESEYQHEHARYQYKLYDELINEYGDTRFYDEVLHECGFLLAYTP